MDLIINDLSLEGQFPNVAAFHDAIRRVMQIREVARRHRRALYCHRGFASGQVTPIERMQAAVNALPRDERHAVLSWLNQHGPFWDDDRRHDGGDWYECGDRLVTDTAVGEAAHCVLHGIARGLISLYPSSFNYYPVSVERICEAQGRTLITVPNFWESDQVDAALAETPSLDSWTALGQLALSRFEQLRFANDAFTPLQGQPFKVGAAERILALLNVLCRLRRCFAADGSWTHEGQELYQAHFIGKKAWFSDSSDSEKSDFKTEMTFPHPDSNGETLFCTWHGKLKTPQYRIHFSWPVTASAPLYVVYVGPKITKK